MERKEGNMQVAVVVLAHTDTKKQKQNFWMVLQNIEREKWISPGEMVDCCTTYSVFTNVGFIYVNTRSTAQIYHCIHQFWTSII